MDIIFSFISKYINLIIGIIGVFVLVKILLCWGKLSNHKRQLEDALNKTGIKEGVNEEGNITRETITREIDPYDIQKNQKEYNKLSVTPNILNQIIPIFPLLGILGTICGLVLQVQAGDVEMMMSSLNVSLVSTFLGLIFSILSKFIMAVTVSRSMFEIEAEYEMFDKDFRTNVDKNSLK